VNQSADQEQYRFVSNGSTGFVECLPSLLIVSEDDALELIAGCGENGTDRLLVHAESLPKEFYDLHSGLAGRILLKMSNYRIFLAAVIPPERIGEGRFSEMVLETNRGHEFRVFATRHEAIAWLSSF
jgi:PadR family transcriptional regulator AphA